MSILANVQQFSKPISVGGAAAVGTYFWIGNVSVYGSVPLWLVMGGISALSSAAQDMLEEKVLPMITNDPSGSVAVNIIQPGITGAVAAGGLLVLEGELSLKGLGTAFVIAGGAEIAGTWINDTVFNPYRNVNNFQ